ncbi:MAG: PfkB family carbohydrate kinase [Methyloligellaceae bacterium]
MPVRNQNSKAATVFVYGMFNILHPGHFRFLNFAASLGNKLTVGVFSDERAPEATVKQDERLENIKALSFIHDAFILDYPVIEYINEYKPDIVVKGWEYHDEATPEKEAVEAYGGRLIYSSGEIGLSDFEDNGAATGKASISRQTQFLKRHDISTQSLQDILGRFPTLNVCVLGDIIVDNYLNCTAVGMSREDPTIVVRPAKSTLYLGGAGIVASHARSLGASVHFISVTGNDDAGEFSKTQLEQSRVASYLLQDETRPTTQKTRYRASGKTLLRVNDYSEHAISQALQKQVTDKLEELLPELDVIIFSDFSYGALPQDLINAISERAAKNEVVLAADSQCSSQIGDIKRFQNMSLITPTEHEARVSLNNSTDGLIKLSEKVREGTNAENIVITLAEEGLLMSAVENGNIVNDRLPALQPSAVDPAGAGDAFLVTSSIALAAGANIWQASYLGSLAAAVQVSRVGNIPIQSSEITAALST